MIRRLGTYALGVFLLFAFAAGCNDDGGGGTTDPGGGGPTNNPLDVSETYEQQVDENTQSTWGLDASDDDGLKRVQFEITYDPQTGQDSTLASIDQAVSNKTWSEQVQAALGPGSVNGTYTITSNNPAGSDDTKSGSFSTQILAAGDEPGSISLSAPAQLTNGDAFSVDVSANDADGIDSVYVTSTRGAQADTTIGLDVSGTSINQSIQIPYNRPNSALPEDFSTSAELVDSDGNRYDSSQHTTTLEAAVNNAVHTVSGNVLNENSNNAVQDAQTALMQGTTTEASDQTDVQGLFSMDVTQQEGTSEDYDLTITKTGYKDYIQTIAVSSDRELTDLMLAPQDVLFTGSLNEETVEDQNALVTAQELSSIVDFQDAGRDTIYVQTSDPNLAITVSGQDFVLDPADGFTGNAQYTVVAVSGTQGRNEQDETLYVQDVPSANITLANNETDERLADMNVPDDLDARLIRKDENKNPVDTLYSDNGVFTDVQLTGDPYTHFTAEFMRNGEVFSYPRTDSLAFSGGDVNDFVMKAVDYYVRDIDGNVVDELADTKEGAMSPDGFKNWVYGIHSGGVSPWNGETLTPRPLAGYFHWYTDSSHPRGPDEVWLVGKIYDVYDDYTSVMYADPQQYSEEIYNNHVRPWSDFELPALTYVDSTSYDPADNIHKNRGLIKPEGELPSGKVGTVSVFGEYPQNIYNSQAGIRSKNGGEDLGAETYRYAASQEQTAAFLFFSRAPAEDFGVLRGQSITHNDANVVGIVYPTNLDGKMSKVVWETDYTGKISDVFGPEN